MSHIKHAVKGNYYWTRRLSHRGYFPDEPIIKVWAKTGGKEFPLCDEVLINSDGTERASGWAHPTSTHCLFETEQAAIEYYNR